MSAESPAYSPVAVKAWSLLSILVSLGLLGMFAFGPHLIEAGRIVWTLLRWLATPII